MFCTLRSRLSRRQADAMRPVTDADLIAGKYLLVQRGKKNYYLVIAE